MIMPKFLRRIWPFNRKAKRLDMLAKYEAKEYLLAILIDNHYNIQAPTTDDIADNANRIRFIR